MATKIEGYGLEDGSWAQMKPRNSRASWRCATMVLHDDDHERVFTESEIRAAAMAEPELPDDMPDEMWEACRNDRATMQEAMRSANCYYELKAFLQEKKKSQRLCAWDSVHHQEIWDKMLELEQKYSEHYA